MKPEKIKKQLEELFGKVPDNFSILDQKIDMDIQMEYFEQAAQVKKDEIPQDIIENEHILFSENIDSGEIKKRLIQIAAVDEPEAFRLLERYVEKSEGEMQMWGIMALQESKMLLESLYLGEPQVYISTGLGGRGQLLRYFAVLFHKEDNNIDTYQEKIVKNELDVFLKNVQGEIEEVKTDLNIIKILVLLPLSIDITDFFHNLLNECNQYGGFLYDKCIITNVKELERVEIDEFIRKRRNEDKNYFLSNEDLT